MDGLGGEFDVRQLPVAGPDYLRALALSLGVEEPASGQPAHEVADMLSHAERCACPIQLVFGAYSDGKLLSAASAVEAPGGAALVFAPLGARGHAMRAASACLGVLTEAARDRSVHLLQVLVDPESPDPTPILAPAGFRYLTRLLYLARHEQAAVPVFREACELDWVQYTADRTALFEEAIELTYAQSLDCPELTGLRSTADVLAGHRATGEFDPSTWWVAVRRDAPVGIMLLSGIPGRRALEIVYMGVAQASRGTGVADALVHRAVRVGGTMNANTLTLAVDQRNTPARRMYARWKFTQVMLRDAWITSPRGIGA